LFAPYHGVFDQLEVPKNEEEEKHIIDFFNTHFPDALSLIGHKDLIRCFVDNPRGSLLTIKVGHVVSALLEAPPLNLTNYCY
jgi:kynurenine 3-monooxygenase